MNFEISNLFSFAGVFIILFSIFISFFISREVKTSFSYLISSLIILIGIFIVLRDERKNLINQLEESGEISSLYKLSSIYQIEENIPELIRVYTRIIEKDPEDETALLNLSVLMIHMGNKELGLQLAKKVISINPENKRAKEIIEILMDSKMKQKSDSER